jgi:hypothetical protein
MEGDNFTYICSTKQSKTLSEAIKGYCNRYKFETVGIVTRDKYGTFIQLKNGIKFQLHKTLEI